MRPIQRSKAEMSIQAVLRTLPWASGSGVATRDSPPQPWSLRSWRLTPIPVRAAIGWNGVKTRPSSAWREFAFRRSRQSAGALDEAVNLCQSPGPWSSFPLAGACERDLATRSILDAAPCSLDPSATGAQAVGVGEMTFETYEQ